MIREHPEPFIPLGSTPGIKKILGGAVALSPVASLVADTGDIGNEHFLRFTDYEAQETIGQIRLPHRVDTLSFSPDGRSILAMLGGRTFWVYSEPWDSPSKIADHISLADTFHGAWLDEKSILVAGTIKYSELCIAIFDVEEESLHILHQEGRPPSSGSGEDHIDDGYCSPSGLVAFSIGYGRQVKLYQLKKARNAVVLKNTFAVGYNGYGIKHMVLAPDERIIVCPSSNWQNPWTGIFNNQGQRISELHFHVKEASYSSGNICLRGNSEVQIYRVKHGKVQLWCSEQLFHKGMGCDLITKDGKTLIALEQEDLTKVFEVVDYDILQLASQDNEQRRQAARSLGKRQLQAAVSPLTRLLWDESPSVQRMAVKALAEIGNPTALPHLIRLLGHKSGQHMRGNLVSALRRFPRTQLIPAIFDCLAKPNTYFRRGAVRVLENITTIEALQELSETINDADPEIRLITVQAIRKRNDLKFCVALLGRLNDEDLAVKTAIRRALAIILETNGLLPSYFSRRLSKSPDILSYAEGVISTGRIRVFETLGSSPIGEFLNALALACVQSGSNLPQILNAITGIASGDDHSPGKMSTVIALMVALSCAEAMRRNKCWREAVDIYRNVIVRAEKIKAPQIEWRAWNAVGECFEALRDDHSALAAFRAAMDVIDQLWFALLEEDKLRNFFQDKAQLYDRAGLCCLRLGYKELALECVEKAKTRYLGDLIARRQMDPRVALEQELREFWKNIGKLRSIKVPAGSLRMSERDKVEIITAEWGLLEAGTIIFKPEHLTAFEEACQDNSNLQRRLNMLGEIWRLMLYLSTEDDEVDDGYSYSLRQETAVFPEEASDKELHFSLLFSVEEIYQALLPIQQAIKTGAFPIPLDEYRQSISQYDSAARAIALAARDNDIPFWVFSEYGHGWIDDIYYARDAQEIGLLLDAVMEALNIILHHEPILGVPTEPVDEDQEGPIFVPRPHNMDSPLASRDTTIIQTALERFTQTRWQYITQLARGESCIYRDVTNFLINQPETAQIQFSITEQGTTVYITYEVEDTKQSHVPLPSLQGNNGLEVFTYPKVTLSFLRQLLIQHENSWFARYRHRQEPKGIQAWMETMNQILQQLYTLLITPLDGPLKSKGVKRLRIIPHRSLHLIPFSALYEVKSNQRHYLLDDYEIEYAPSATLYGICKERAENRTAPFPSLRAISNPTGDLPFAAAEVEQIVAHFPPDRVQIFRGHEARRQVIEAPASGSIFHFAGHGSYNWDDPLESHLLFAGNEPLKLADLFAEKVPLSETKLVILSACETNITNPDDLADEYLGLASGFLFAGTPAVISSLWAVDDLASTLLVERFYQHHLQGKHTPATSLRLAQLWLRNVTAGELKNRFAAERRRTDAAHSLSIEQISKAYRHFAALEPDERPFAHPYYWAAFTFSGV